MKFVIAQMKHETNTFSPVPTPIGRFARGQALPVEGRAAWAPGSDPDVEFGQLRAQPVGPRPLPFRGGHEQLADVLGERPAEPEPVARPDRLRLRLGPVQLPLSCNPPMR